ncbi:hypothetical protein HFO09_07810 [Rhizobium laguerreae]|uniref:hypothetical protein n=1 Tax=Rhizobium laguerreae TaxID=1076926 RepID=UPI001C928CD1|nr:hypothetical protein [Rhizobium laguerreae]MBY3255597.1 hypothetical protein [Rhizobium laguerreae]MBY3282636.1 hypothetical protein [Rhizobium laguerreae]MBY3288990.1 hypothetical protein [Rhizobium laguerreae]
MYGNLSSTMSSHKRNDLIPLTVFIAVLIAIVLVAFANQKQSHPDRPIDGDKSDVSRLVRAIDKFDPWQETYAQWLAVCISAAGAMISWRAVVLVKETLEVNRAATNAAAAGVEASIEANRLTTQQVEVQSRAWISFDTFVLSFNGQPGEVRAAHLEFIFRNTGVTPALEVEAFSRANVDLAFSDPDGAPLPDFVGVGIVAPTGSRNAGFSFPLDVILASRSEPIIVHITFRYRTIFGAGCEATSIISIEYIGLADLEELIHSGFRASNLKIQTIGGTMT